MSSKDAQAPSGDKIFLQLSCHLGTSKPELLYQPWRYSRGGEIRQTRRADPHVLRGKSEKEPFHAMATLLSFERNDGNPRSRQQVTKLFSQNSAGKLLATGYLRRHGCWICGRCPCGICPQ